MRTNGMKAILRLTVLAVIVIFASCPTPGGSGTPNPTYTVTYDGNGNTGGSVPTDSTKYEQNQTVTVLGNTGALAKGGAVFAGWNTQAGGGGTTYTQGQTFTMGAANVTLNAKWTSVASNHVIGVISDGVTGDPISGATVHYGTRTSVTDGSGNYDLDLGQSSDMINDAYGIEKTGYAMGYIASLPVDAGQNWSNINIRLTPQNTTAYPTKTVTGKIFFAGGVTEIPDTSKIVGAVLSKGNGYYVWPSYNSGYSITINVFSSDCLMGFMVDPLDGVHHPFIAMATNVDLSGTNPVKNLTEAPAMSTIILNLGQVGNSASASFITPYGYLPMVFRYNSQTQIATGISAGPTPASVEIYNPDNWQAVFYQQQQDSTFNSVHPGHNKMFISSSDFITVSSSITLPNINSSLGPTGVADPASLAYSSGVLSLPAVTGAGSYSFQLTDNSTGDQLAMISSISNSSTLPSWITSALSGKTVSVNFQVFSAETAIFSISTLGQTGFWGSFPANNKFAQLSGDTIPYTKVLSF